MSRITDRESPERIKQILEKLTVDIGVRLAGSSSEEETVEYLGDQFAGFGAEVQVERFPVRQRLVEEERLEIQLGGSWRSFPCSLFSNTPGTGGQQVEAPLCFFESPAEYLRDDLSLLRGKAVVHLGCHIESRESYRRLVEAWPAFLLFVDIRYPGQVPLADGMFPAYTESIGALPTANVAYMDAWQWKKEGATAARLCVKGGMKESTSQNVIATLPGTDGSAGVLIAGAHHDTQAGSPGADDNGTGVAALLEIARLAGGRGPFKRSIRLISFGAEEQLSVGSASYVRQHRKDLVENALFMLNFDSFGSPMGWTELTANGPREMVDYLLRFYREKSFYMKPDSQVMPYADHFPFVAAGIPGVFITRNNCTAGRFFHHRPDDDIYHVSPSLLADWTCVSALLLEELANVESLPFPGTIPSEQADRAALFWKDLFGGWQET